VTVDFTEEHEQEMAEWLQASEQEFLLNKKHPNYVKKGLKDGLAGGQQSGAKQQRPGSPHSSCVETDENARIGSILYLSENSPAVFLVYF